MSMLLRCALAAATIALGAQGVSAQPVTSCPAGQAMQSSDPSGKKITCVAIPDLGPVFTLIEGLTESDIVGRWSVTGPTSCLQSTNGFNSNMAPLIPPTGSTTVSHLVANSMGTRTFVAGGTGTSSGTTQSMTFPGTFYGAGFSGLATGFIGGASVSTFGASFTWSIQLDGTLRVDDDNTVPQAFLSPPVRVGSTATIMNFPPYTGYISKDKRTITLVHAIQPDGSMQVETSVLRDATGAVISSVPRFCNRYRVLTRLPD